MPLAAERLQNLFYNVLSTFREHPHLSIRNRTLVLTVQRRRLVPDPPGHVRYDLHRTVGEAITALLTLQRQKVRRGYQLAWG